MKKRILALIISIIIIGLIQFIRPKNFAEYQKIETTENLAGVPKEINDILQNSCFNCHSSSQQLEWYDKITPINFLVDSHIQDGKKVLNFSNWGSLASNEQKGTLYYGLNKILSEEMPLPSYAFVHPSSKLSIEQIEIIKNYLVSITPRKVTDSAQIKKSQEEFTVLIKNNQNNKKYDWVKPAPNGIEYIPDYREWKAISTTDRFDNGTIRIIFANKDAVTAIQKKQTNPWPDGSIFAKVLWKQEVSNRGIVSTGEFVHVEYMIKDSKKYAQTEGWGWARWTGKNLKPYGNSASFVNECIKCHRPVKDNDNVFTKPLNLTNLQKNRDDKKIKNKEHANFDDIFFI